MATLGKSFLRLSNATGIRRFGEQLTWIQEPDIFHLQLTGTLQGDEVQKITAWQNEWGQKRDRFFVICNMTQLRSISPEARRIAIKQENLVPSNMVTIVYGASFALRVVAEMSERARKLMGSAITNEFIFVATEADAFAEIEKRRACV